MTFTTIPRHLRLAVVAASTLALPFLAACGSTGSSPDAVTDVRPAVVATQDLVVIDVRTPEEFSEQHLEGALNINLQGDDFVDQISALDRNGNYAVYCRSGNRSAQAVAAMKTLGFTNVTDHGSVAEASETLGIAVIS